MANQKVLVIGGGIGGLTTALVLARCGIEVDVVERDPFVGGHAAQFACKALDACVACGACLVEDAIEAATAHPLITLHTSSGLDSISPGHRFAYRLRRPAVPPPPAARLSHRDGCVLKSPSAGRRPGAFFRGSRCRGAGHRLPHIRPFGQTLRLRSLSERDHQPRARPHAAGGRVRPPAFRRHRTRTHRLHPVRGQPRRPSRSSVVLQVLLPGGPESRPADQETVGRRPISRFSISTSRGSAGSLKPSSRNAGGRSALCVPSRRTPFSWTTTGSDSPTWTNRRVRPARSNSIWWCCRWACCRRRGSAGGRGSRAAARPQWFRDRGRRSDGRGVHGRGHPRADAHRGDGCRCAPHRTAGARIPRSAGPRSRPGPGPGPVSLAPLGRARFDA